MGAPMTLNRVLSCGKSPIMTPLLGFLAGPHAYRMARLWPAPHAGFFVLPTARRHAAAILAEREAAGGPHNGVDIVHAVERMKDSDLARLLMGDGVAGGFMKALGRMGESLWEWQDYAVFLRLFADPETVPVLRHMREISPRPLSRIALLPSVLQKPGILANLPESEGAAVDLAEAYRLALLIHGASAGSGLVKRWDRAGDAQKLFDMAAEALHPTTFGTLRHPPKLPATFERIMNQKALNAIALEFRNCLRDFAADLALERMAVYAVRERPSPPVALALRQDAAGWRLAEAKLVNNEELGDPHLRHLVDVLKRAGVRTGESTFTLAGRLHDHVCPDCGPAHMPRRETWRERLMLGTLWDG